MATNAPDGPLRDIDLVKWLDNKLGDTNELWSGSQTSSLLTKEMLIELESCFEALEPHVKLKIIQAIPHLSPKLVKLVSVKIFSYRPPTYLQGV